MILEVGYMTTTTDDMIFGLHAEGIDDTEERLSPILIMCLHIYIWDINIRYSEYHIFFTSVTSPAKCVGGHTLYLLTTRDQQCLSVYVDAT